MFIPLPDTTTPRNAMAVPFGGNEFKVDGPVDHARRHRGPHGERVVATGDDRGPVAFKEIGGFGGSGHDVYNG